MVVLLLLLLPPVPLPALVLELVLVPLRGWGLLGASLWAVSRALCKQRAPLPPARRALSSCRSCFVS